MNNVYNKKIMLLLTSFFCFLFIVLSGIIFPFTVNNAYAFIVNGEGANTTEENVIFIDQLWISGVSKFNGDNALNLLKYVSGNENIKLEDITDIYTQAEATKSSNDMREQNGGKDVIVKIGELDWTVTYLSLDSDNNAILTLWLANSSQLSGKNVNRSIANNGAITSGVFDEKGHCVWNDVSRFLNNSSYSTDYPDNMYGTSSIRSAVLNNGGEYFNKTSLTGGSFREFPKQTNSVFTEYTCGEDGGFNELSDFIVTPEKVSWQQQQSFQNQFKDSEIENYYNRSNEAWGEVSSDGFRLPEYNYSVKTGFDAWKSDKLWLPSSTEVGAKLHNGKWCLSANQLSNIENSWLRSTFPNNAGTNVSVVNSSGGEGNLSVTDAFGSVRPAMHLNISHLVEHTTIEKDINLCTKPNIPSQKWNPFYNPQPEFEIIDNNYITKPVKDKDYTITYPIITKPGTYQIQVEGKDRYKGTMLIDWVIEKREISFGLRGNEEKLIIEPKSYTSFEIKPTFENLLDYGYKSLNEEDIKLDEAGKQIVAGENAESNGDYYLIYDNNIELSTAENLAKITFIAIGEYYTGSFDVFFQIVEASIKDANFSLSETKKEYYFNEDVFSSSVTTTLIVDSRPDNPLTLGEDYELLFFDKETFVDGEENTPISSITQIGFYYIVAQGIGNYRDTIKVEFEVTKGTMKIEYITLNSYSFIYNGKQIIPEVSLSYEEGKEYNWEDNVEITYGNNINVSQVEGIKSGKVFVKGINNLTGNITVEFDIIPKSINSSDITNSSIENQIYKVTAIMPDFILTDISREENGVDLVQGNESDNNIDFFARYSDNINVGTATITLIGKGNYEGTRTINFNIVQRDISLASFSTIKPQFFTGEKIEPEIEIIDLADYSLKLTEDFTVVYSNNINVTQNAKAVISGIGNYKGSKELDFAIAQLSIKNGNISVTLKDGETSVYTGTRKQVIISLTLGSGENQKTVSEFDENSNANYVVSYELKNSFIENNPRIMNDAGIYKIKVTGQGNYAESVETEFSITKYDISNIDIEENTAINNYIKSFAYNSKIQKPEISLNYLEINTLLDNSDFTTKYLYNSLTGDETLSPINVGIYYIVLTGKLNSNYTGTLKRETFNFEITQIEINEETTIVTFSSPNDNFTFNAKTQKLEVLKVIINGVIYYDTTSVNDNDNANQEIDLSSEYDYLNISYYRDDKENIDFINFGIIKIIITAKNQENISGEYVKIYRINQKSLDDKTLNISGIENRYYNREVQNLIVSISDTTAVDDNGEEYVLKESDFYISYLSSDGSETERIYAEDNIKIIISAKENGNYSGSFEKSFSILKAIVNGFVLSSLTGVYNEEVHMVSNEVTTSNLLTLFELGDNVEYRIICSRDGEVVTIENNTLAFTNVGDIVYTLELLDENNFEFSDELRNVITYKITPAPVTTVTLEHSSFEYNSRKDRTIEILSVISIVGNKTLTLSESDYKVTYDGSVEKKIYKNVVTVIVEVTGLGNFGSSSTATFSILAREVNKANDLKYYEATVSGEKTENLLGVSDDGNENITNIYKGEHIYVDINIEEDGIENSYKLNLNSDFNFAVYTKLDYDNENFENNLLNNEAYFDVNNYVLVVTCKNNFSGTLVTNYTINTAELNLETVSTNISDSEIFTNKPIVFTREIILTYTKPNKNPIVLKENTDFELFSGYAQVTYKQGSTTEIISARKLTENEIANLNQIPNVVHIENGYLNNVNVGNASIFIESLSNNFNSNIIFVKQFKINPLELYKDLITILNPNVLEGHIYTGSFIIPEIQFKSTVTGEELEKGIDYIIAFSNNKNASNSVDGSASFVIEGIGNYTKSAEYKNAFNIARKEVDTEIFSLKNTTTLFNEQLQKPVIIANYNGMNLIEETDYYVLYRRNGSITDEFEVEGKISNAGIIKVTIEGIVNFSGALELEYNIKKWQVEQIWLSKTETTYNSLNQKPTIRVLDELNKDVSTNGYELSFSSADWDARGVTDDWVNAGEITISVILKDNVNFSLAQENMSVTFTIHKWQIEKILLSKTETIYNRRNQKPTIRILDKLNRDVSENGYSLKYSSEEWDNNGVTEDWTNFGTILISVILKDNVNYSLAQEDISAIFIIKKANLNNSNVTINKNNMEFTGESANPIITVKMGIDTLSLETDYNIEYYKEEVSPENKVNEMLNVGNYIINITGKNNYEGDKKLNYKITAYNISLATLNSYTRTFMYNTKERKPELTLTYKNVTLVEGIDFIAKYQLDSYSGEEVANPINAGKYFITLTGNGNFSGLRQDLRFEITKLNLENAIVSLDETLNLDSLIFDNTNKFLQVLSVKMVVDETEEIELLNIENKLAKVTYLRNGLETEDFKSSGDITVEISSANLVNVEGKYQDIVYTIARKDLKDTFDNNYLKFDGFYETITYNKQAQTFDISITDTSLTDEETTNYILKSTDYTITYDSECIEVEENIRVVITASTGNYTGTIYKYFSIVPAVIDSFELESYEGNYTGKSQIITGIVKAGDLLLEQNVEYTFNYKKNGEVAEEIKSIGNLIISLKLIDNKNYIVSDDVINKECLYDIKPASFSEIILADDEITYDRNEHSILIQCVKSLTVEDGLIYNSDYSVSYKVLTDNEYTQNNKYTNVCEVEVKITGNGNFAGSILTTIFKIIPRELNEDNIVKFFVADNLGNKINPETEIDLINGNYKYRGNYLTSYVTYNKNSEDDFELTRGLDYNFYIFTKSDYDNNLNNNLFLDANDTYLNANSYVLVIAGIKNFSGKIVNYYNVESADFNKDTISLMVPDTKEYKGQLVTLNFDNGEASVKYKKTSISDELSLELDKDFILYNGYIQVIFKDEEQKEIDSIVAISDSDAESRLESGNVLLVVNGYINNDRSGLATIVLTGKNPNFKNCKDLNYNNHLVFAQFEIPLVTLDVNITNLEVEYDYMGKNIEPNINVISNITGQTLVKGKDYEIKYTNNLNVSKNENAKLILTGIGNYSGTVTRTFKIKAKEINLDMFTVSDDTVYNRLRQEPEISGIYVNIDNEQVVMQKGTDYLVTYKRDNETTTNLIDSGIITIEITGDNNYIGKVNHTYIIETCKIKDIVIDKDFTTYTGYDQKPEIKVLDTKGTEVYSEDYILNYSKEDFINAGVITISVALKENEKNYTLISSISKTFMIKKALLSSATTQIEKQTYLGVAIEPKFTLKLGEYEIPSNEYIITNYTNNLEVGTASIILNAQNINFTGSLELTFEIDKKDLDISMLFVTPNNLVYNGNPITLDFVVSHNSLNLLAERDYTFVYKNNVNANSNDSASLIIEGINNFYGTITYNYSIEKAKPIVKLKVAPSLSTLYYGDSFDNSNYFALDDGSTSGTLTNETLPSLLLTNNIKWNFTPTSENYSAESGIEKIPAYYYTEVTFSDVSNVLVGQSVSVYVKAKLNRKLPASNDVPEGAYNIVITLDGEVVEEFNKKGTYNIKVVMTSNDYAIAGSDNITFQVKETTIYSSNNSFYAYSENGFDNNLKLDIKTITSKQDIINLIGEENFNKISNISKVYTIAFVLGNSEVNIDNVKVYFNATNNSLYYLYNNNEIVEVQTNNNRIEVSSGALLIETTTQSNYLMLIIIGVVVLVVLIVIVVIVTKVKKKKKLAVKSTGTNNIPNGQPQQNANTPNNASAVINNAINQNGYNFNGNPNQNINPQMQNSYNTNINNANLQNTKSFNMGNQNVPIQNGNINNNVQFVNRGQGFVMPQNQGNNIPNNSNIQNPQMPINNINRPIQNNNISMPNNFNANIPNGNIAYPQNVNNTNRTNNINGINNVNYKNGVNSVNNGNIPINNSVNKNLANGSVNNVNSNYKNIQTGQINRPTQQNTQFSGNNNSNIPPQNMYNQNLQNQFMQNNQSQNGTNNSPLNNAINRPNINNVYQNGFTNQGVINNQIRQPINNNQSPKTSINPNSVLGSLNSNNNQNLNLYNNSAQNPNNTNQKPKK